MSGRPPSVGPNRVARKQREVAKNESMVLQSQSVNFAWGCFTGEGWSYGGSSSGQIARWLGLAVGFPAW